MKGEFQMQTKSGTVFDAVVPEFIFAAPSPN